MAISDPTASVEEVRVQLSESGDFLVNSASTPRNVDVEITNGVGRFVEATQPDANPELNGVLTVTVLPDPKTIDTYTAIPEVNHSMQIIDNDNDAVPSLTIAAGTPGDESGPAMFNIVSVPDTDNAITSVSDVMLEITQVGNYLASSVTSTRLVDIPTVGTNTQLWSKLIMINTMKKMVRLWFEF